MTHAVTAGTEEQQCKTLTLSWLIDGNAPTAVQISLWWRSLRRLEASPLDPRTRLQIGGGQQRFFGITVSSWQGCCCCKPKQQFLECVGASASAVVGSRVKLATSLDQLKDEEVSQLLNEVWIKCHERHHIHLGGPQGEEVTREQLAACHSLITSVYGFGVPNFQFSVRTAIDFNAA